MICWKVSHKYKLIDHIEYKDIGIYNESIYQAQKSLDKIIAK